MPFDNAFVAEIPVIVKAKTDGSKRMISVEASSEAVDSEGDVVLQSALLDASAGFLKSGHLDLDHLSELGDRLGISDPTSYIIGHPTKVVDLGDGRTGVEAEIMRSATGKSDTAKNKYDAFWESLQSDPPVKWRASIYGFPTSEGSVDCRKSETCDKGAKRYLIKSMQWRSLAMTRNPINTDLKGFAKVITAKAFMEFCKSNMGKGMGMNSMYPVSSAAGAVISSDVGMGMLPCPYSMVEMIGVYHMYMKNDEDLAGVNSVEGFKDWFMFKCGMSYDRADLMAHALMYHLVLERKRAARDS